MKKGLLFVLIAVLSAGLLLTGCSQDSDGGSGTQVNIGGRLVDITVDNEDELLLALNNPDYQVIGVLPEAGADELDYVGSNTNLTTVKKIPAGKTVVLYTKVIPSSPTLDVEGTLVIEGSGVLAAGAANRVRVTDGNIEIINGTIQVEHVVDVHGRDIEIQILGTSKAYFADGTLSITQPLPTLDDVKIAFSWVPKGTLRVASVTQPVKPSELTLIPTTLVRRLTIAAALVSDPLSLDTATTITVPAGMTFETADPLASLEELTVAGNLTATGTLAKLQTLKVLGDYGSLTAANATFARLEDLTVEGELTAAAALFNNVETLSVSGTITAANATYDQVTTLVVDGGFDANAANFNNLQSLTVKEDGAFTTTGVIGSNATDALGITLDIQKDGTKIGKATVGAINKLKSSAIAGSLTASSFTTFDTNAALTAAAGGTINGVTFPAETLPITSLSIIPGANPNLIVTIDDYTVPRDETLTIAQYSTLVIPTGKVLTIQQYALTSGAGVIKAYGSTNGGTITIDEIAGYTTDYDTGAGPGVTGNDLRLAVSAFAADTAKLKNNDGIDLRTTFFALGTDPHYYGIGSVVVTVDNATAAVYANATGATSGTAVTLDTNTTVAVTSPVSPTVAVTGTGGSTVTSTTISIEVVAGALKVGDSGCLAAGSTDIFAILTFTGLKLQNRELINPVDVPAFSIGLKTKHT